MSADRIKNKQKQRGHYGSDTMAEWVTLIENFGNNWANQQKKIERVEAETNDEYKAVWGSRTSLRKDRARQRERYE